jgi:hypothetical protein
MSAEVTATLAYVDEFQRAEALAAAEKSVRSRFPTGPLPEVQLGNEETYQILFRALRDAEDPKRPFADSVDELRLSIVKPVAAWLYREYELLIEEEFPTIPTDEQFDELVADAEKKSLRALLTSMGFLRLARALPSLAAHFARSPIETSGAGEPSRSRHSEFSAEA